MNNLANLRQLVDNSVVALFLSTALSIDLFFNHPLDDAFGHKADYAKGQT